MMRLHLQPFLYICIMKCFEDYYKIKIMHIDKEEVYKILGQASIYFLTLDLLKHHLISVSCLVIKEILKSCQFVKRKMRKCKTMREVENRNEQFEYIAQLKKTFIKDILPVLSIDTNKKEIIGNFYQEGKVFANKISKLTVTISIVFQKELPFLMAYMM